mgnify:CR=1 FL=1
MVILIFAVSGILIISMRKHVKNSEFSKIPVTSTTSTFKM